ncbi:hypothetical protein EBR96_04205, partial [bacterium]|nr:hypothetical protein [bacterium]
ASGYFEKAHALEPDELEYAISYAVCKFQHDDFERVETICQSVGNKGKDCFELQSIRAKAAIKANRLHLAKTVLTHLIQMDPNEPNHQIDAGMVAMMLDDPEAAATHWAAAVRLAPEYLPVFNELVSLLLEMNRPKEVIQLAILLKKYPEAIHSASIWIATGYLALNQLENATAEIQFLSGQVQESLNAINQSIANNPDNDSLHAIKESIQTRAAGPPH